MTIRSMNVEPLLLLFSIGLGLYNTVYQASITYKVCLEYVPGQHAFCRTLGTNKEDPQVTDTHSFLNKVQIISAHYLILYQLAITLPSIMITLVVGSWCDSYGRKPPLILATVGASCAYALATVCVSLDGFPPVTLVYVALLKGCTGQTVVINCAGFAMISDSVEMSNARSFTMRVGIASGILAMGNTLGYILGGIILRYQHYAYVYVVACSFMAISFLYAVFILKETLHMKYVQYQLKQSDIKYEKINIDTGKYQNIAQSESQFVEKCENVIENQKAVGFVEQMKETFRVLIKQRPERGRLYLLISCACSMALTTFDPSTIINLYIKRPPFSFTDSNYSYLLAMNTGLMVIGEMVVAVTLQKFLKINHLTLIMIGTTVEIGSAALAAVSTKGWMIVVAYAIGGLSAMNMVGFRSYFGGLVDNYEKGRLYAAVFISDTLATFMSAVITNNLYALTLSIFPGTVYVLSSCVSAFVLLVVCFVQIDIWRRRRRGMPRITKLEDETTPLFDQRRNNVT